MSWMFVRRRCAVVVGLEAPHVFSPSVFRGVKGISRFAWWRIILERWRSKTFLRRSLCGTLTSRQLGFCVSSNFCSGQNVLRSSAFSVEMSADVAESGLQSDIPPDSEKPARSDSARTRRSARRIGCSTFRARAGQHALPSTRRFRRGVIKIGPLEGDPLPRIAGERWRALFWKTY